MNIFFGNGIQWQYDEHGRKVLFVRIFNDVQQAESRNGQLRRQNWSLKEENMPSSFQVGSILRPSRSSDLWDKMPAPLTRTRLPTATISLTLRPIQCYTHANKATVTNFQEIDLRFLSRPETLKSMSKQWQLRKQKTHWLKSVSERKRDRWFFVDLIFMHSLGVHRTVFDHVYRSAYFLLLRFLLTDFICYWH